MSTEPEPVPIDTDVVAVLNLVSPIDAFNINTTWGAVDPYRFRGQRIDGTIAKALMDNWKAKPGKKFVIRKLESGFIKIINNYTE